MVPLGVGFFVLLVGIGMLRSNRRSTRSEDGLGRAIDLQNSTLAWSGIICGAAILAGTIVRLLFA